MRSAPPGVQTPNLYGERNDSILPLSREHAAFAVGRRRQFPTAIGRTSSFALRRAMSFAPARTVATEDGN